MTRKYFLDGESDYFLIKNTKQKILVSKLGMKIQLWYGILMVEWLDSSVITISITSSIMSVLQSVMLAKKLM